MEKSKKITGLILLIAVLAFASVIVTTVDTFAQGSDTKNTEKHQHADSDGSSHKHGDSTSTESKEHKTYKTALITAGTQTKCPVMGGTINKAMYVDAVGKRVYVCCAGCINKLKADPAKYISKLEDEGVTLQTVDTKK